MTPRQANWSLDVRRDFETATSQYPMADEAWRATDSHGHAHHWEHGYPTLTHVIDAQHWCDGTEGLAGHDPHWAVDESHYECSQCREHVVPGTVPPGTPVYIRGLIEASLTGVSSEGQHVTMWCTEAEVRRIQADPMGRRQP
jgi:hypothetical protein